MERIGKRSFGPDRSRAYAPDNNKTGNKQQRLVKGSDLAPHPCVLESPWRWLTGLIMVADRGLFIWMSDKNSVAGVNGTELLMGVKEGENKSCGEQESCYISENQLGLVLEVF